MLDQNLFTETIREVAEIIQTSQEGLSDEEILKYFESMELNENQKKMVLEYFLKPQDEKEDEAEVTVDSEETLPQSPVFQMYMDEIRELPVCTKEELEDLYEELLEGEVEALKKISDSWMIRVVDFARELSVTA